MIIAIGNPVYDFIKTPLVDTKQRIFSGCSTNACLVLSKLGYDAPFLVGNVGSDYRENCSAHLARYGISSVLGESRQTGGFGLVYDETGDRTLEVLGIADPIRHLPENWDGVFEFAVK